MKLLFDANLSPKLVGRLADLFPDSAHVFETGLAYGIVGDLFEVVPALVAEVKKAKG